MSATKGGSRSTTGGRASLERSVALVGDGSAGVGAR